MLFSFLRRQSAKRASDLTKSKSKRSKLTKSSTRPKLAALSYESLEDRNMMATFAVANLNDSGAGSFRQALVDANNAAGADVISFTVAGSIQLQSSLPKIIDEVDIDGTTAPGYTASPVVELDFNGKKGLRFEAGSSSSSLQSLALVDASGAGVKLNGVSDVTIVGNYVGVTLSGSAAGNQGEGIDLVSSFSNTIGGDTAAERNVISANRKNGVRLKGSSSNEILGNYIGTNSTGSADFGNGHNGIMLTSGSNTNLIGVAAANLISGNDNDGVHIKSNSNSNTVAGNFVGTNATGTAALGNSGDGVEVRKSSGNVLGNTDAVSSIDFYDANDGSDFTQPVDGWQGIRAGENAGEYMLTGTSGSNGLLYIGTIDGDSGTSYLINYPGASETTVYGPDNLGNGNLRLVGTYRTNGSSVVNSFLFEGTTSDLANPANYRTINFSGAEYNYAHSTAGGLVVGNYDNPPDHGMGNLPYGPGNAFIYDIAADEFLENIVYPGSQSNSVYGVWHNEGTKYTFVGGYSNGFVATFDDPEQPLDTAYMVDFDSSTGEFSNWASFNYPGGTDYVTHFEGISSVEKGVYTLAAVSVDSGSSGDQQGSFVTVRRNADGSFGEAEWVVLDDPSFPDGDLMADSVYGNQMVGIVIDGATITSYQATINSSFQLSNVISGNGGNGINLHKASSSVIAMNYIGTDVTGTVDLGNVQNGIQLTSKSTGNLIGGEATGGNAPTTDVFVVPPQGNLISGNNANGVLIQKNSTGNQLSGNFIGTTATGNSALGNSLDGVYIHKSDDNTLLGCTFQQDPFVFYNVISGNLGNGLRVYNSDDTTIQANFFGMGADNDTAVGNAGNGVLVEGNSTRTVMGGPIPMGNVVAANAMNGIVVQDKASYFTSYNTFCGLAAFKDDPTFGNGMDGILITSSGAGILLRTNVVARNGDDGIEVSGNAKDVRIPGNIIGLNTYGFLPMGNADNGIEIGGNAQRIVVGGPQPTFNVAPRNAISHNGNNGVAIVGSARNNIVSHSYIGTDSTGSVAWGNGNAGVYIGAGSYGNTIGSDDPALETVISGNDGNGIEMRGTYDNTVIRSFIGVEADGTTPMGNGANGVLIADGSYDNTIGGLTTIVGNTIANNTTNGVSVTSGYNNGILINSIYDNALRGIHLSPGANNSQAAPSLLFANSVSLGMEITGTFTSTPNKTFTLEFFASEDDDWSGQFYLGSLSVTTDANGDAEFTYLSPTPPNGADYFTATATDSNNNTSEFSNVISE
jgi:parallel beta-helix repeat protein